MLVERGDGLDATGAMMYLMKSQPEKIHVVTQTVPPVKKQGQQAKRNAEQETVGQRQLKGRRPHDRPYATEQSVECQRAHCYSAYRRQAISCTAHRAQRIIAAILAQCLAQASNMDIHRARIHVNIAPPYTIQQLIT